MIRTLSALAVWAVGIALAGQDPRVPIPDASAQKEKEKLIREVYRDEYKSKVPADRIAFAEKLLKQGKETKTDPAAQYVMYREAMSIASEERAVSTAFGAIEALAVAFEGIREIDMKLSILTKAKPGVKSASEAITMANHYVLVSQLCWRANSFETGHRALTEAASIAKAGKDMPLIARINELASDAKEAKDAYEKAKPTESVLAINENDPEANAEFGWFLCFYKGDSETGLRLLSKGPPDEGPYAEYTRLVQEESKAEASKDLLAVGDKWLAVATKSSSRLVKRNAQAQARRLFERALQGAEGLSRAQIERRIADVKDAPAAAGVAGPTPIDLLGLVDPKRDAFAGTWERDGANLKAVKASFSRLEVPYEPPQEYDLKVTFLGGGFTEAVALLSRGGKGFAVGMKPGQNHGGMYRAGENFRLNGLALPPNTPHTLLIQVRTSWIKVHLDGKEISEWKPDQETLGPLQAWNPKNQKALGLGATGDSMVFQHLSVVELSGRGKRLR